MTRRRSGASACGHSEHTGIVGALENRDGGLVSRLMLHHIDHIETDLDLRVRAGPAVREALNF